jgi:hypothetical protein
MMKKRIGIGIIVAIFTFCILGCGETEEETEKVLKVTGISLPQGTNILGAALMANIPTGVEQMPKLEATGFNNDGTFKLYNTAADGYMPDASKPWKGKGNYYIVLSTKATADGEQYVYTAGAKIIIDEPPYYDVNAVKKYNFKDATTTIAWDQFDKLPIGQ